MAAPSARCASRMPASSASFLIALGSRTGSRFSISLASLTPLMARTTATGRCRIDHHALVGGTEFAQRGDHGGDVGDLGEAVEALLQLGVILSLLTNRVGMPVLGTRAKPSMTGTLGTSRPRRLNSQLMDSGTVRTTASALSAARMARSSVSLSGAVLPARLWPRNSMAPFGGGRAVGPDGVDEVADRHEGGGLAGELLLEVGDLAGRVQPGIEADLAGFGHVIGDLGGDAALHGFDDFDHLGVGLGGRLQGVAAIDEQGGLLRADNGEAGRAGEAGHIGEAGFALRHRLAAMRIGARHEEGIDPRLAHCGAQRFHPAGHGFGRRCGCRSSGRRRGRSRWCSWRIFVGGMCRNPGAYARGAVRIFSLGRPP